MLGDGAMFTVGIAFTVIITSSVLGAHIPLDDVQRNVAEPTTKPVTAEVAEDGVVMLAAPEISVQLPVPTVGVLPARVVVNPHKF